MKGETGIVDCISSGSHTTDVVKDPCPCLGFLRDFTLSECGVVDSGACLDFSSKSSEGPTVIMF